MTPTVIALVAAAVIVVVALVVVKQSWRSVLPGRALVINKPNGRTVSFTGALVIPIVNRADEIDLAMHQIVIARRGREGVICADNLRADLSVTFCVRVNRTVDDVLRVAETIGCARASDPRMLEELFTAKFSEAIKTVGKQLQFEEMFTKRDVFKDQIIAVIGTDLNGFILDDAAIDYLEQTPIEHLDPNHVLDAQGIRKIREHSVEPMSRPPDSRDLYTELKELGVQDVHVDTQLACDVSSERAALVVELEGGTTELAKLPASVTRGVVEVIGRATLRIEGGRATLRWRDREVPRTQLVAGARLIHAFRDAAQAYR